MVLVSNNSGQAVQTLTDRGFLMVSDGRGGGIRTHGLFVPNEARYQTALRPDMLEIKDL